MKNIQLKKLFHIILFSIIPIAGFAQTNEIWGLTKNGGTSNNGTIFKTDINGNNHTVIHEFFSYEGNNPNYNFPMEASNGNIYGTIYFGGVHDEGVLFEYNPTTDTYLKKYDFLFASGIQPLGSLIEINSKLYGVTVSGGQNGFGVIYEFAYNTNTYTVLHNFDNTDGRSPSGTLLHATNGKLYGMTSRGGASDDGIIYEYDINTNVFTKKIDFDDNINIHGSAPLGHLTEASNGLLYGMTRDGGEDNVGVIFQYNIATNSYEKKFDFNTSDNNGHSPDGGLIEGPNNSLELYGMCHEGSLGDGGVLFKYSITTNEFSVLSNLNPDSSTSLGSNPIGSLFLAQNNKFYGTTSIGYQEYGTVFEFDPETLESSVLHSFTNFNGKHPSGDIILTNSGDIYGLTTQFGYETYTKPSGSLYRININNEYTELFKLNYMPGGALPEGSLTFSPSNGKLYGMSKHGGLYHTGVIFEINPTTNTHTKLVEFGILNQGNTTGAIPSGNLTYASNGLLYGLTAQGGLYNAGAIIEFNPNTNSLTVKHHFNDIGSLPMGSLLLATNNKFYGLTLAGGDGGVFMGIPMQGGIIFEYDPLNNTFNKLHDFKVVDEDGGSNPYGSLIEGLDGSLYGLTSREGLTNEGGLHIEEAIFKYNLTTGYEVLHSFNNDDNFDGDEPQGDLVQINNGKLYGLTSKGGTNNNGVIFEYDLVLNQFTKRHDFSINDGINPEGTLIESSVDGKLYGVTTSGGINNHGTMFNFDPNTFVFTKIFDFNGINDGSYPVSINIFNTEILSTNNLSSNNEILVYPNPVKNFIYLKSTGNIITSKIYNSIGQFIFETKEDKIDLRNFIDGVYFIHIITNQGVEIKKIIKN